MYKVGMKVKLNGKEYEIIGTYKRSWMLEDSNGKHYKCTSNMMKKIEEQNSMGIGNHARKEKSSTYHLEKRLAWRKIWEKDAKMPETESEMLDWLERISSDLSPENLSCDGELSRTAVNRKYRELMAEWREIENLLGRKVSEDEIESRMMAKWRSRPSNKI